MSSLAVRGFNRPTLIAYNALDIGVRPVVAGVWGQMRLSTEPIGVFALTLTNVVVGSGIQIEDQAGTTTLYNGVAASSNPTINLDAYSGANPLNDLRIKVRKGTATPFYRPFETLTTAVVGSQSIYVAQIPDE